MTPRQVEDMKSFAFRVAERFGVHTIVLLFVGLLCWRIYNEVATPMLARHLQFVDTVESSVQQQTTTLQALGQIQQQQLIEQANTSAWCRSMSESATKQQTTLEEIKAKLQP